MLYLSRLILNPRCPQARGDLADCRALHSRVLHAFPDSDDIKSARAHFGVLYRVEVGAGGPRMLVQSHERPDWSRLPAGYVRAPIGEPKRVDDRYAHITVGQVLRFRLRANPTRCVNDRNTTEAPRWRGKRVELRREEDQIAWLARKGAAAGFTLVTTEVAQAGASAGVREFGDDQPDKVADVRTAGTAAKVARYLPGRKVDLAFGSVVFEGRLRVTDAGAFRRALAEGIGSGKAFGFGLLSVAPIA